MSSTAELPAQLNFGNVTQVLERSDALLQTGSLDLAPVQQADSAGIALLLELTRRAQTLGKPLVLRGATPQLRELSAFFGVDSLLAFQ